MSSYIPTPHQVEVAQILIAELKNLDSQKINRLGTLRDLCLSIMREQMDGLGIRRVKKIEKMVTDDSFDHELLNIFIGMRNDQRDDDNEITRGMFNRIQVALGLT